ncbi:MAG: NAD(P)-dependent oxidoreductase [Acidiferrobacterales bacterium]
MINSQTPLGFIGLGIMGRYMAGHLLDDGFEMHLYNRTKQKADELLKKGANWQDSAGAVAQCAHVIFTMVGTPSDVHEVYLGPGGLIEKARPGSYLVDMTTSQPGLATRIYEAAKAKDLHALDAPVSGGEKGAREAVLTVMVGGDSADFEAVAPLLKLIGNNVVHQGASGNGQHTKMCNQIVNANTIMGVAEGLAYAQAVGLDMDSVLRSITTGSASSFHLSNTGPKMIAGDFDPGFAIHHMIKDLEIALKEANDLGLGLAGARCVLDRYRKLMAGGLGGDGIQAIYKLYRDRA